MSGLLAPGGQAPYSAPAPFLRDDGLFAQTGKQTWLPSILERGDRSHGGVLCERRRGAALGCRGEEKHGAGNGGGDEKQGGGAPWDVYI